jgi:hypothetical protein
MSFNPTTFAAWLARNPEPSVMALAEEFGGFGRIPRPAWDEFQGALDSWAVRLHLELEQQRKRPRLRVV